jgi:hypothetical protein
MSQPLDGKCYGKSLPRPKPRQALRVLLETTDFYFLNSGLRFSRKAVMPSLAASVQAISAFPS